MPRPSTAAACVAVAVALVCLVPTAVAAAQAKVLGGFFEPGSLDMLIGEEVTWISEDAMPHTVTSSWDQGATFDETVSQGDTFAHTFSEAGTYTVHCKPHAYYDEETGQWEGMVMTVNVRALDPGAGIGEPVKGIPGVGAALGALALIGAALVVARRRA